MRKKKNARKKTHFLYIYSIFFLGGIFLILNYHIFFADTQSIVSPLAKTKKTDILFSSQNLDALLTEKKIQHKKVEEASESAYLVVLDDGSEVIFSKTKEYNLQISSLQLILSRFTIEGKRLSKLDLRFDNPIVTVRN